LSPAAIPLVKNAIRSISLSGVQTMMKKALKLASSEEVAEMLGRELRQQAPRLFGLS
jgi:hypothetical protein